MTRAGGACSLAAASLLLLAACPRERPAEADAPSPSSPAPDPTASALPAPPEPAPAPNELDDETDPVRSGLLRAPMTFVSIVGWKRPGVFRVLLDRKSPPGPVPATLQLSLVERPIAYRGPLAFARLAQAISARVVPKAAHRRVGTGELGALFASQRDLRKYLVKHAAVQNDGTVDALVFAPARGDGEDAFRPPKGRDVPIERSAEMKLWARWAASPEPFPGERASLVADYVELLALDYLAGNVLRRTVHLDPEAGALHLLDNTGAFPAMLDPLAEAHLLARLRLVMRFPRRLRDALLALDRARTPGIFTPGAFETWLLSPRALVDLDERRQTLLALIAARIAERGEDAVLSL